MRTLYRMNKATTEAASLFGGSPPKGSNAGEEGYPGYPGLVFDGTILRTMTWGFPLSLKGKSGQPLKPRPVNNTRSDKLTSPFWRSSFEHRRCPVPMTVVAEAEGQKGHKTRTWLSLAEHVVFDCAGIWRDSDEWGSVYSVIVTEPSEQVRQVHDRMPVVLKPDRLSAPPEAAAALCRPYGGEMLIDPDTPAVDGALTHQHPIISNICQSAIASDLGAWFLDQMWEGMWERNWKADLCFITYNTLSHPRGFYSGSHFPLLQIREPPSGAARGLCLARRDRISRRGCHANPPAISLAPFDPPERPRGTSLLTSKLIINSVLHS